MNRFLKNKLVTLFFTKLNLSFSFLLLLILAASCSKEVGTVDNPEKEFVCKLKKIESPESTTSFIYNLKGFILTHSRKSFYPDNTYFEAAYSFNYDSANKITGGSYFNDSNGKKNTTNFTLVYNGDLVSQLNLGGHSFFNFSYNEKKQLNKVEFTNTCCSDVNTTVLEYDGAGNVIKTGSTYSRDTSYFETTYTYGDYKNPASMISKLLPIDFFNNTPFFNMLPVKTKHKNNYNNNETFEFEYLRSNIQKDENGFVISSDLSVKWDTDPLELIGKETNNVECK